MCGLYGYAVPSPHPKLHIALAQLAIENKTRGRDSWGLAFSPSPTALEEPTILKGLRPIDDNLWALPEQDCGFVLGHTRAATVGAVTEANSHPWLIEGKHRIVGAHNGSVGNHKELNERYKRTCEVDSMHIFHHIADDRPLKELQGYGAITFIRDGRLWLGKFNGGSLSVAHLKQGGIVWSSLEFDLKKSLESIKADFTIYTVKVDQLYMYWDGALCTTKYTIPISTYTRSTTITHYSHHQGYHQSSNDEWRSLHKTMETVKVRLRVAITTPPAASSKEPLREPRPITKNRITEDEITDKINDIFDDTSISVHKSMPANASCPTCYICKDNTLRWSIAYERFMCLRCIAIDLLTSSEAPTAAASSN